MIRHVFISGSTGYMGRALARELLSRGHGVRALVRPGSEAKVPSGCSIVYGDALDASSFAESVPPSDTFVHLVGTPHPAPWKEREFRAVDLTSARESIAAAGRAGVYHFVYVSVAHPAPVMHAYIAVRRECEEMLRASGLNATIIRPWYVLGPGHRWPAALLPLYRLFEALPSTRDSAVRLGLVSLEEMVAALVHAVENPPAVIRVIETAEIRRQRGFPARPFLS